MWNVRSSRKVSLSRVRPSQDPHLSSSEQLIFEFFTLHILNDVQDELLESKLWHNHILRIIVAEPILRCAVMALGALGRYELLKRTLLGTQFYWRYYDQTVALLSQLLSENTPFDVNIILVTCILLTIFESRQRAWHKARHHLLGGLSLMTNTSSLIEPSSSILKPEIIRRPLLRAFRRLGNQILLFFGGLGQDKETFDDVYPAHPFPTCSSLMTLTDAQKSLNVIGAVTRHLASNAPRSAFSLTRSKARSDDVEVTHQELGIASEQWASGMQRLKQVIVRSNDHQTARILEIQYLCGNIKASMITSSGAEMLWDNHYAEFLRICQLSVNVILEEQRLAAPFSRYFLDSGVLIPLHFVAHRCRDPTLRRVAIGILDKCDHREGTLDGTLLAQAAAAIMNMEEQGITNISLASDVPEHQRVREAFFDLQTGCDMATFYDPNRFESASRKGMKAVKSPPVRDHMPQAVRNAYCSLL